MDQEERDEEPTERPRPRVVDKRASARRDAPAAPAEESSGSAGGPAPTAEPETAPGDSEPGGAQPSGAVWTPEQEPETGGAAPGGAEPSERVWTPEQEAEAQRIAEEIARVPALDWVLSSCMTLTNVAAVKLDQGDLEGSQLAIDALDGLMGSLGSRLGANEAPLKQVLAQLKMTYAQAAMPH
jgi:hypothetical protein